MTIIPWESILYHKVRANFYLATINNRDSEHLFKKELEEFGGKIDFTEYEARFNTRTRIVTDNLGMNDSRQIVFDDEPSYLMFLLKWS